MDGSRFDWELRQDDDRAAVERAGAGFAPPAFDDGVVAEAVAAEIADRPGAPTAAWAPVLIWMTLGATVAISVAL